MAAPPHLTAVSPSATASTTPQVFTVTGSKLVAGLTASLGAASSVTSTRFTWTVVLATAGTVALQVRNPDGRNSNTLSVLVAAVPPPPPPPPPSSARGPQFTIVCPVGAVSIGLSTDLQTAVNANPAGTAFCLAAGVHTIHSSVIPKTGNTFVGAYGAILDGTGWTTTDDAAAAFQGAGGAITGVTIRNLVIRSCPKKGVYNIADCWNWTVEYCEITACQWGVVLASGATLRNNVIHHNGQGIPGLGNYSIYATQTNGPGSVELIENNEIAYGGGEQKAINSSAITWRDNWIHHNDGNGIWNDGEGSGSLMENNIIEDNGGAGIVLELSTQMIVRTNTIRRNGDAGILLSTSRDMQVYGNTLENNFRGVTLFLTCVALTQGWPWNPDLRNNSIHDNTITLDSTPGAIAVIFGYTGDCLSPVLDPYVTNAKANVCQANHYRVPNTAARWWYWATYSKTWALWQALPQDVAGTLAAL